MTHLINRHCQTGSTVMLGKIVKKKTLAFLLQPGRDGFHLVLTSPHLAR